MDLGYVYKTYKPWRHGPTHQWPETDSPTSLVSHTNQEGSLLSATKPTVTQLGIRGFYLLISPHCHIPNQMNTQRAEPLMRKVRFFTHSESGQENHYSSPQASRLNFWHHIALSPSLSRHVHRPSQTIKFHPLDGTSTFDRPPAWGCRKSQVPSGVQELGYLPLIFCTHFGDHRRSPKCSTQSICVNSKPFARP